MPALPVRWWRALQRLQAADAPRVVVRPAWPTGTRWVVVGVFLLVLGVTDVLLHDGQWARLIGRASVSEENSRLKAELAVASADVNTSGSRLRIEQTAQAGLESQLHALEVENGRLRQELAFFETLMSGDARAGELSVRRAEILRDGVPDAVHFRALLVRGGKHEQDFVGQLQAIPTVTLGGRQQTLPVAEIGEAASLKFRYYQRLDGVVQLPAGAVLRSLQLRVLENGAVRTTYVLNPG